MPAKLHPYVERLFREALDLPPEQRHNFLARITAQRWVRGEVESLLAHHERAEAADFLTDHSADPALPLGPADDGADLLGQTLGPYTIINRTGAGSFGAIYRAVRSDGQYQGEVALKVLRRGRSTPETLRRFRIERQALACLQAHPHIVTLLDSGSTPDGRPYLVLEAIDGRPIDQYCDAHGLGMAARLRLFLQACAAVQYAHQNRVIHCDLKPENILVTQTAAPDAGAVKLIDFGIAHFLGPDLPSSWSGIIRPRGRPLTPAYASPEQVRGDHFDRTTDVYSLGVLLYELLSGHRPFALAPDGANWEHMVCNQEPERPSRKVTHTDTAAGPDSTRKPLTPEGIRQRGADSPRQRRRQLAGDLDQIILKAMHKRPEQRYRSVAELAQDLLHYLEGRPVAARGHPWGYRPAKFVRRHAGTVAAVALALAVIGGLTGWALRERGQALRERDRGLEAEAQARQAVRCYVATAGRDTPGLGPVAQLRQREWRRATLQYYQDFLDRHAADPALQLEVADAHYRIALLTSASGSPEYALEKCRPAYILLKHLASAQPARTAVRSHLAEVCLLMGQLQTQVNRGAEASDSLQEARTLLEGLAAAHPANLEFRRNLAVTYYSLGKWHTQEGRFTEAVDWFRRAEATW